MKFHFIDLIADIKAILGINGVIWIYYSTVKLDNEYFTDDQTKINTLEIKETPTEWAAINIILFKNIIKSLENHKCFIDQNSIMKFYELYIEKLEKSKIADNTLNKLNETQFLKKNIVIEKNVEILIINQLREKLRMNSKSKNIIDLYKDIDMIKNVTDMDVDDDQQNQNIR